MEAKKSIRFKRGEIKIACKIHEEEEVVKVAHIKGEKPIFLCLECLIERTDFVKNNKQAITSVESYFSKIIDKIEELRDGRQEKIDSMPKIAREFYDNYYKIQDTFKDEISLEKGKVPEIFKSTVENIVDYFVKAGDNLKEKLEDQEKKFFKNSEYLREKIDENYCMNGIPGESEILKNINNKSDSIEELDKYVDSLINLKEKKDQDLYSSFYDLAYHQIHQNLKNPPKIKVNEEIKERLNQLETAVKDALEVIVEDLRAASKDSRVVDISNLTLEEARRNVSQDGLCAFMKFESDNHKVSFKLHKKIMAKGNSAVTCIMNIGNNHIATGSRDGSLRVYNINNSHLIAELELHKDLVTCLCTLTPIWDFQNAILCSGSANLDGRIIVWNIFDTTKGYFGLKGHSGNVTSLANLGNRRSLVSSGHDGYLILWDCETGDEVSRYLAHSSMISCLRFIHCKKQLLSAGWDSNIKVWNLGSLSDINGQYYSELRLEKSITTDSPVINVLTRQVKGNFIVVIGANNRLKVWNIETEEVEGEFLGSDNRAEVCLIENKYKFGKADFITLNTSVREELNKERGYVGEARGFANGYDSMSSFHTQPKVQIIQNNKEGLRLVKVINHVEDGTALNVYEIV